MRPPDSWRAARVTLIITVATFVAWLLVWGFGLLSTPDLISVFGGFIPGRAGGIETDLPLVPFVLTPITATLIHAGWIHVGFNLLFLAFCGRPVETIIGGRGMVILYLVGAYAAAAAQYAVGPASTTPMVGASGAISAVLGVYAIMFGRNRVKVADPRLALWLNALWLAAAWIGLQLVVGFTFETAGAQIAIAAHIGGFLAGLLLAKPLLLLRYRGA